MAGHLLLINPISRRKVGSRRVVKQRRKSTKSAVMASKVKKVRHHSAAMRRKISLAVKAAIRRNKPVARRVSRPAKRQTMALAIRRNPIRRSLPAVFSRRLKRRSAKRSGGLAVMAGNQSLLKTLTARSTLEMAGGAVASTFLTGFILNKVGTSLPGYKSVAEGKSTTDAVVRVAYKVAIPVAGAYLVRKVNKNIAHGMILGGIVTAVNELIYTMGAAKATASTSSMPVLPSIPTVNTPVKGYVDYASRGVTRPYNGYVGRETSSDPVFGGSAFRQTFGGG